MKITVKNFQKKAPIYPKRIKKAILKAQSGEGLKKTGEITICFVNDGLIRQLNKKFHHSGTPTDVLSFDVSSTRKKNELSADIIVSADTACRNAKLYKTSVQYELKLYAIHGLLHFLGYDDRTAKQRKKMQLKAEGLLQT